MGKRFKRKSKRSTRRPRKLTKDKRAKRNLMKHTVTNMPVVNNKSINMVQYSKARTFMPNRFRTVLQYKQQKTITVASNGTALDQYRINSVYDPDFSVFWSQYSAAGHSQLAEIYSKYRVYAAAITICLRGDTGSEALNSRTLQVTIVPIDVTVQAYATPLEAAFNPKAVSKTITSGMSSTKDQYMSQYVDVAALFGIDRQAMIGNYWFVADTKANPLNTATWQIYYKCLYDASIPPATTSASLPVEVSIRYYVEYFDLWDVIPRSRAGEAGQTGGHTGTAWYGVTGGTVSNPTATGTLEPSGHTGPNEIPFPDDCC